jgi:uncharacterized membrane protein
LSITRRSPSWQLPPHSPKSGFPPSGLAGADGGFVHDAIPARTIGLKDLRDALRKGWADFMTKSRHVVFLGLIDPVAGLLLAKMSISNDLVSQVFLLLAGFALIGPFARLGLHEISRRRKPGLDASWRHALDVFDARSVRSILVLGVILFVLVLAWPWSAAAINDWAFGGHKPGTISAFLADVFTISNGWWLIVVGHALGVSLCRTCPDAERGLVPDAPRQAC